MFTQRISVVPKALPLQLMLCAPFCGVSSDKTVCFVTSFLSSKTCRHSPVLTWVTSASVLLVALNMRASWDCSSVSNPRAYLRCRADVMTSASLRDAVRGQITLTSFRMSFVPASLNTELDKHAVFYVLKLPGLFTGIL